jgi:hypothetical protein
VASFRLFTQRLTVSGKEKEIWILLAKGHCANGKKQAIARTVSNRFIAFAPEIKLSEVCTIGREEEECYRPMMGNRSNSEIKDDWVFTSFISKMQR